MKFHSDSNQPTVKGAGGLAVPPGSDPLGFVLFLELFAIGTSNIPGCYLQVKKKKIRCAEGENEGVFYCNRNLPHTLLSTAQGIL